MLIHHVHCCLLHALEMHQSCRFLPIWYDPLKEYTHFFLSVSKIPPLSASEEICSVDLKEVHWWQFGFIYTYETKCNNLFIVMVSWLGSNGPSRKVLLLWVICISADVPVVTWVIHLLQVWPSSETTLMRQVWARWLIIADARAS